MIGIIKSALLLHILGCLSCMFKANPMPANATSQSSQDPLINLGQIALKMVEHIASAEDEGVDMEKLADFVTALSKATVVVKHPEIPQLNSVQDEVAAVKNKLIYETGEIKNTYQQLEESLQATQDLVVKLQTELNKTRLQLMELKGKFSTQQNPVGFTASATSSQSLSSSTVLRFNKLTVNYSNHYDPSTGYFTCPVRGLYLVSVKVDEYGNAGLILEVLVAGVRIMYLYDSTGSYTNYMSVSGSVLTECQRGNKIWVKSVGSGQIYGQSEANLFSVYLVVNQEI